MMPFWAALLSESLWQNCFFTWVVSFLKGVMFIGDINIDTSLRENEDLN